MLSELLSAFKMMVLPLSVSFIVAIITFVFWALHRNRYWKNLNVLAFHPVNAIYWDIQRHSAVLGFNLRSIHEGL